MMMMMMMMTIDVAMAGAVGGHRLHHVGLINPRLLISMLHQQHASSIIIEAHRGGRAWGGGAARRRWARRGTGGRGAGRLRGKVGGSIG